MAEPPPRRAARRNWRTVVPRPLRHGITVFVALLAVEYFVIPRFVTASHDLYLLARLNYAWLAVAICCEAASQFSFGLLTRTLIPARPPSLATIERIDYAALAISHVLPAGSAGSAGLGYRLLTTSGVDGRDAGFAMATQSLGSTVVLNVLLWLALVISIPLAGFNAAYVATALAGMLALVGFASLVFAFTVGEERSVRVLRALGRRIRPIGPDRLESLVRHTSDSIRELARDRQRLRSATAWATVNWLADACSLWAFVFAFGATISPIYLFVAYGVANVLAALPITPGGLGVVEASATGLLTGFGVRLAPATLAVLGWRLFNFWLPIPIGAGCYLSLKLQRGAGLRARRSVLSNMAVEATAPGPGGTAPGVLVGDELDRRRRAASPGGDPAGTA